MSDFIRKLDKQMKEREEIHKTTYGATDPLKGWTELELEAYRREKPKEVEESLLDRKIQQMKDKALFKEKRAVAEVKLRVKYPDALNPKSQLAQMMETEMENSPELRNNPQGRFIAAQLASLELEKNPPKAIPQTESIETEEIEKGETE